MDLSQPLSKIGEIELIKHLSEGLTHGPEVSQSIGDDCAVVDICSSADSDHLLTSDPVIQGVHFDADTDREQVGRKAIGRVLSDIAAMGGRPAWALINVVAPASTAAADIDLIYRGMTSMADSCGLSIIGGDLAQGPTLEIHVFAIGSVPKGKAVLRSGACAGDIIFVTGSLGGSSFGKHLSFTPRLNEGLLLSDWATSMIDITDGLSTDLLHITEQSEVGAVIKLEGLPISDAAKNSSDSISDIEHALHDGEDFELLFTIPESDTLDFIKAWNDSFLATCTEIGVVSEHKGKIEYIDSNGKSLNIKQNGYEHFKSNE